MRLSPYAQIRWLCLGAGLFATILLIVRTARVGFGSMGLMLCTAALCLGLFMGDFVYLLMHGASPVRDGRLEVVVSLSVGAILVGLAFSLLGLLPTFGALAAEAGGRAWTLVLGVGLLLGGLLHLCLAGGALGTGRSPRQLLGRFSRLD